MAKSDWRDSDAAPFVRKQKERKVMKYGKIGLALVEAFGAGTCLSDVEMWDIKDVIYDTIRGGFDNSVAGGDAADDAAWDEAGDIAAGWDGRVLQDSKAT
jgi:hypothetical protein